jgi:hypothetical protein
MSWGDYFVQIANKTRNRFVTMFPNGTVNYWKTTCNFGEGEKNLLGLTRSCLARAIPTSIDRLLLM